MKEIQELLYETDWTDHPLGPYSTWPGSLKVALGIMIESKFPKMVFWGSECYVFYNAAFRPSLGATGKHPTTFGMPYNEAYPEAKAQIRPLLDQVLATGASTYFENQLVPIYRDGQLSEAYWTYSHTPLRDEHGKIVGVFLDCFEVTSDSQQTITGHRDKDFRSLADSISQPVFATNNEGGITYSNKCFMEYTGKSFSDLQDFGWNSIIPEEDLEGVMEGWMDAIQHTKPYVTEIRYIRFDGVARWFLAHVIPVLDAEGKVERWVGSAADIQNLKDQETEKDIFIGMASHELKTPVTSIKGYVQLLQRYFKDTEDSFLSSSLDTLDRQVRSLTKLIGDMLDLSRIKTGNLELDMEIISIDDLVNDVIKELSHVNPDHNFIYTETSCDYILGDKERIGQVLINFLTNAIKYAPNSHDITISCKTKDSIIRISVIDKGIGLEPHQIDRLFERFYRAEGKNQETFPGLGIGLYIAEDIIRRHGGKIGAESVKGKGSTFYFELPTVDKKE